MPNLIPLLILFLLAACQDDDREPMTPPEPPDPSTEVIDLLALGDSYTKGESVPTAKNFPNQLAERLRAKGFDVPAVRIIAQTGWRTDHLKTAIAQAHDIADSTFGLVTLCIGVNNQYQGADFNTYKVHFSELLQTAIGRAGGRRERVIVLSIPDWAFTPYGQSLDPGLISPQIDQYNAANRSITQNYGVAYVDITEISRRGVNEPDLVANDGLHPSAKQYTLWVEKLLPVVEAALKQ